MKYKIFELDTSFSPPFGELKHKCLLVETFGVFDKDEFENIEDAIATIKRYKLNGRRYTVLPVFE